MPSFRSTTRVAVWAFACLSGCTGVNPQFGLEKSDADPGLGSVRDGSTSVTTGSLIGYWRFEEGQGSERASDQSGYGHHGVVEGLDVARVWVPGYTGTGLSFPAYVTGTDPGVRVPMTAAIDGLRTFTVGAWIKRSLKSAPGLWTIISRQLDNTADEVFDLASARTELEIFIPREGNTICAARATTAGIDGRWLHVVATYDGGMLRLYADGVEVGSGKWVDRLRSTTTPLYIGTNKNPEKSEPFEGVIDEVVLFSKALSASAVKALAAGASPFTLQ
jgi:concanavalin A-like lectin/glucanase superfamily protein